MGLAATLALILTVASFSFAEHDNGAPHNDHHDHHDHNHKDLESAYSFKRILVKDSYTLHWSFDVEQETISFAINVSTDGWVGFGLSPNGGMAHSDVVIGWIKDGNAYLEASLRYNIIIVIICVITCAVGSLRHNRGPS